MNNVLPRWPDLPRPITSFGAAIVANPADVQDRRTGALFVYGGHHGSSHHYANDGQSGDLLRLSLDSPSGWEVVSSGPRLQGLALLAHGASLVRVGGFEARNARDQEQDLWSLADAARFDLATGVWSDLPSLPEGRSSFDAVLVGDTLFVVGGWSLRGAAAPHWCDTALALDLSEAAPSWRALPDPAFQRRALAVGAVEDRLYAIGGMQPDGSVSQATAVYDVAAKRWSDGPDLPGDPMESFGAGCCTAGGRLYVSTSAGNLLRLTADGGSWQTAGTLPHGRFFHRMLAVSPDRLLLLGGAAMMRGKFATVQEVRV